MAWTARPLAWLPETNLYRPLLEPPCVPWMPAPSPLQTTAPPPVQYTPQEGPTPIPTKAWKELNELRKVKRDLTTKLAAASKLLANSGLFTAESSGNLIKRKGGVPKSGSEKDIARRVARAQGVLTCAGLIQGDDLVANVHAICLEACTQDPKVKVAMMDALCTHAEATVPDKRFKCGVRVQTQQALIGRANGFRAMVSTYMSKSSIDAVREFGGKRVIDSAEALQGWAVQQSEMPEIKFVHEGESSAVFTPLEGLIKDKLMTCKRIVDSLRTAAPYKDNEKQVMCYMVLLDKSLDELIDELRFMVTDRFTQSQHLCIS